MQILPATILPGILDVALHGHINIQQLFERAGIDHDLVGREDRYITINQLGQLLTEAFEMADDDNFGLLLGEQASHASMGLLGQLMASAGNLRDVLKNLFYFKDLLVPYIQFELVEEGPLARLTAQPDDSLAFARTRIHNDVTVASMVSMARSLLADDIGLVSVSFRHAPPDKLEHYERFFKCPLHFNAPVNGVALRREKLDKPLPGIYPKYHQRLYSSAQQQLQQLQRAQGISGQVHNLLEEYLGDRDKSSVEAVAAELHMTARTLQRRLREEGLSFIRIRDQLRHEKACRLLLQKDCDMKQVALRLGFSELANFYHAFKRWQGISPGNYRRKYVDNSD